jgi:hypothetical protein
MRLLASHVRSEQILDGDIFPQVSQSSYSDAAEILTGDAQVMLAQQLRQEIVDVVRGRAWVAHNV